MDLSFGKIEDGLKEHADWLAFIYQITEKDIRYAQGQNYWQSLNLQQKLQFVANVLGGRTVGYNPFPAISHYDPTFVLGNAINKTSIAGGVVYLAAEFGIIPASWKPVAKKIVWGGVIGGVFDAPGQPPGAGNPTPIGRQAGPGAASGVTAPAAITAGGNYFGK